MAFAPALRDRSLLTTLALACSLGAPAHAWAVPIRDLCEVGGVRANQLVGYGLVVGLAGTGDSARARFSVQSVAAMLRRLGATVDPAMLETRNVAAVTVTAMLPAFAAPGARIDVTVSSLGDARSLSGGTLLQTPLFGADRNVYAVAQGALVLGAYEISGRSGSSSRRNHATAGQVPGGAIVERRVEAPALAADGLELRLRLPSFATAQRVAAKINESLGEGSAVAADAATIRVQRSDALAADPVAVIASIEALEVEPDSRARIVIDERTGTVVISANVRIGEVAIAQGGLTVEVSEETAVSQPNPLGRGDTARAPTSAIQANEDERQLAIVPTAATLADLVAALNALELGPRELLTIFQSLRAAGALHAEIEVQ